jgi:hypothetical protein
MDQITLVSQELDDGRRLIDVLLARGLDVRAALWAKPAEASKPYLYIVSPKVDDEGPGAAYHFVHDVLRSSPDFWIKPLDVRVVGVNDSLGAVALKAIEPRAPASQSVVNPPRPYPGMMRVAEGTFGGLDIDWAFIYPPPADAAAKQG